MTHHVLTRAEVEAGFFKGAVARIRHLQRPGGAIPWYDGGVVDPWNHTEAAMALAVLGEWDAVDRAWAFLADHQLADGSWWAQYGAAVPMDESKYTGDGDSEKRLRDTNFCAYPAVGLWHRYLVTQDLTVLRSHWPMIRRAMEFVLSYQSEHGEIRWAADDDGTPENDALITGCSSIFKSLACAIAIARRLGEPAAWLEEARARLGHALRHRPDRFDRAWESKQRYSMDWFYPVLAGVFPGADGRARLDEKWDIFVVEDHGCRCVSDQPWVTVAESCELVMALLSIGERETAERIFAWQHQWRDETGAYWMGYQYETGVPWPQERPAWTAAAAILAADALLDLTPASRLFTDHETQNGVVAAG